MIGSDQPPHSPPVAGRPIEYGRTNRPGAPSPAQARNRCYAPPPGSEPPAEAATSGR